MFLTKEKSMSKRKDPPGYPGDEAFRKKLGEVLRELRLQNGLSIDKMDAFIDALTEEDVHPPLPRALALMTKQLREAKKMSRVELSEASGVPLGLTTTRKRTQCHGDAGSTDCSGIGTVCRRVPGPSFRTRGSVASELTLILHTSCSHKSLKSGFSRRSI